ncbi:hypothetical protein HP15_490 [Marinobacter adhaerens HP15]|uniref:Uncharacterized protein n=1 Tax=Marinobacter adhaerens (strain DSM 23420 / HP15) TaxID=225937 RepID=E4PND5_MARAH|nr:hypothetical protein HP15_490 [Marinobacter adhaerens HP15]
MCLAGPESFGDLRRLPEKLGRYSILQTGEKSSFIPSADTGMRPTPVSAQLLSKVRFVTLLDYCSQVLAPVVSAFGMGGPGYAVNTSLYARQNHP